MPFLAVDARDLLADQQPRVLLQRLEVLAVLLPGLGQGRVLEVQRDLLLELGAQLTELGDYGCVLGGPRSRES